ncbi:MAG: hypothetical protein ACLU4P_06280 [Ruminococcus sp.]
MTEKKKKISGGEFEFCLHYVTHDQEEALSMSTILAVFMNNGEIQQDLHYRYLQSPRSGGLANRNSLESQYSIEGIMIRDYLVQFTTDWVNAWTEARGIMKKSRLAI